jgi:hypothetical protein
MATEAIIKSLRWEHSALASMDNCTVIFDLYGNSSFKFKHVDGSIVLPFRVGKGRYHFLGDISLDYQWAHRKTATTFFSSLTVWSQSSCHPPPPRYALQIILDLCIPEKELAKTHSQISSIHFQSHSWYSVRNLVIPKGIMETRFEPRLPRMSSWKSNKNYTMDLNSGPLHHKQVCCHWTIKAD